MNVIFQTFDRYVSMLVCAVSDIMTEYKHRKWANKEKNLMIWEVSVIMISVVLASLIVSQLKEPDRRVRITPLYISFEAFLKLLPDSFNFIINFFASLGNLFIKLGDLLRFISMKLRYFLGPVWDIIIYVPCKIFDFLHFLLVCLASILTSLCLFMSNFFDRLSFYLSWPFKLIFNIFNIIGSYLLKFFEFLLNLPGISHLLTLLKLLLHNLVILVTSFFVGIMRFGDILGEFLESFDLSKLWDYLKNFRLFRFLIDIPKFIFNFFYKIFSYIFHVFGNVLRLLKLYDFFASIFLNLYELLLKLSIFIVDILAKLALFLHNILIYIPKFCNWLIVHLKNIQIKFLPFKFMRGFFTCILSIIKWIFLFPVFLLRRFIGFLYFLITSFSFDGLKNWWDNLCKDQPGGCGKQTEEIIKLTKLVNSMAIKIDELSKNLGKLNSEK